MAPALSGPTSGMALRAPNPSGLSNLSPSGQAIAVSTAESPDPSESVIYLGKYTHVHSYYFFKRSHRNQIKLKIITKQCSITISCFLFSLKEIKVRKIFELYKATISTSACFLSSPLPKTKLIFNTVLFHFHIPLISLGHTR